MAYDDVEYRDDKITGVARNTLGVQTLESRGTDSLDFHSLAVWNIRQALIMAFEHGRTYGKGERNG